MLHSHLHLCRLFGPPALFFAVYVAAQGNPENGPSDVTGYDDGAIPGGVGYADPDADEGSSGDSRGSVNLSTGAQVAIIVIAVIVVILGIISAVLFYLAKKRQWQVRASIRRSARRVAESIKSPLTPTSPRWPRPQSARHGDATPTSGRQNKGHGTRFKAAALGGRVLKINRVRDGDDAGKATSGDHDLEKGVRVSDLAPEDAPSKGWKALLSFSRSRA
ncbi:hypothetical protein VTO42DRAFT_8340 [Malbranchea cinnamomea]